MDRLLRLLILLLIPFAAVSGQNPPPAPTGSSAASWTRPRFVHSCNTKRESPNHARCAGDG